MRDEARQGSLYLITNSKSPAGERGSFHPSTPLLRHHPRSLSSIAPRCHPPRSKPKRHSIFRAINDRRFDDEWRTIISNRALSTAWNLFFPSPPLRNFFLFRFSFVRSHASRGQISSFPRKKRGLETRQPRYRQYQRGPGGINFPRDAALLPLPDFRRVQFSH